jgi:hypothetical protein
MKRIPIETPYGVLSGRDAIYLDRVIIEDCTRTLVLEGSVSRVTKQPLDVDFSGYSLRFSGVLAFRCVELDSTKWDWDASFEEILESDWVRELGGKVTLKHRHFFVQTYDDVFDVVCDHYEFTPTKIA